MIIQGLGNLAAPYGTNYKSAVDRETLPVSVAVYGEKVSISDAGKALADADAASSKLDTQNRLAWLSDAAHSLSESEADKLAKDYASASDGVLVTDESIEHPPLRLASTGQILTDEAQKYFDGLSNQVKADREQIYSSEKAKGTPAADIIDKMLAYNDSLPMKYQILAGYKIGTY